jgi:hypothetical protein
MAVEKLWDLPWAEVLDSRLVVALRDGTVPALANRESAHAFSLPLLSAPFCAALGQEVNTQEGLPGLLLSRRIYLDDISPRYTDFANRLLKDVLSPISAALYGDDRPLVHPDLYGIAYSASGDADSQIKLHQDDGDYTLNVCLEAEEMEGSELVLCDGLHPRPGTPDWEEAQASYAHEVGRAILHPSDCWHGVKPIAQGRRTNLICLALRDDEEWKRSFYPELREDLVRKKARTVQQ